MSTGDQKFTALADPTPSWSAGTTFRSHCTGPYSRGESSK